MGLFVEHMIDLAPKIRIKTGHTNDMFHLTYILSSQELIRLQNYPLEFLNRDINRSVFTIRNLFGNSIGSAMTCDKLQAATADKLPQIAKGDNWLKKLCVVVSSV